jgi:hypothetical protein
MSGFTDHEKSRIRLHLGYPNVTAIATFQLGLPAAIEPLFILESAMNLIIPGAEDTVRNIIAMCDKIEAQMIDDLELLAVDAVDEIKVRSDEQEKLVQRYIYWTNALAQQFGVMRNPYDKRFINGGGINVPVMH